MRAIEMTGEELSEILDHLPLELKKKIAQMIKPDSGIRHVKSFLEQYEDDDMIDHIIAHTISNLIGKIGSVATSTRKDWKKSGKKFTTLDMGLVVIECLKDEAKNIEEAFEKHEKDCKQGKDCGVKH